MALETLFRIEDKFTNLVFILHIRRDPELGRQQLYLVDDVTNQNGKLCLTFFQALGDTAKDHISCFPFLKHQFTSCDYFHGLTGCAVDERERLLYVLFGGGVQGIFLKLFHLRYQAADNFGYRRIIVEEGRRVVFGSQIIWRHPPPVPMTVPPYAHTLSICPDTGRLVTGYVTGGWDNGHLRFAVVPADLVYDQKHKKGVVKAVTDRLPLMTTLQTAEMELRSNVFSRSNHALLWQNFHRRNWSDIHDGTVRPDDDGCTIVRSFSPRHPVNGQLNEMRIDPVKLVQSLLPKSVFDYFVGRMSTTTPKYRCFGAHLHLLGHVHKYVIFDFHHMYIMAAKLPKEWYKLPELPAVRVSRVLSIDKQRIWGHIDDACLLATELFLKSRLGDEQVVRRMELGQKFKDYRCCAFCSKEENGKKRNKEGKRISKFKVFGVKFSLVQTFISVVGSESDSSSHDDGNSSDDHQDDTADGQDALEVDPNSATKKKKSYDEFKSSQEREICCNRHGLLLVCGFDGIGNTQQCGMHEATDDQMAELYKRVLSRKRELKNERYSKIEDFALNIVDGAWNLECGRQGESGILEPDLAKPEKEKPRKVKKPKEKSVPAPPEFDPTEANKEPDVARAPAGVDESEEEKQRRDDLHKLSDLLSSAVRHLTDGVFDVARGKLEECQGIMGHENSKQLLDANNYAAFQYCYIKTLVQSEDVEIIERSFRPLREFRDYISEESGPVSDSNVRASCNFLHVLLSAQYFCRWNEPEKCKIINDVMSMDFPEPINYPSVSGQSKTAIEESKQDNLKAEFERIINSPAPSLVMKCCTDSINVQYKPIHRRTEMFLGDPDCDNYVRTECGNKCVLQFHQRCWEDFLQKRNFPEDYVQSGHFPCLQCDSQVTKFDRFEWDEETDEFVPVAIEVSVQPQTTSIEQPDEASVGDSSDRAIPAEPDIPANLSENTVDTEEKPKKKRAQKENIIVDTSDDPTNSSSDSCPGVAPEDHQRSRSTSGVSSVEEEGAKTDKVAQEVLEETLEKTVENLNAQGDFEENTNDLGPTVSQEQLSAVTTCSVGVQSDVGSRDAEELFERCEKLEEQCKKNEVKMQSIAQNVGDKEGRIELLVNELKVTKADNERLRQTEEQMRAVEEQLKEAETQLEKERDRSKSFKANASALKAEIDTLNGQQPEASMKNEFKEMKSKVDQLEKDLHSERDRTTSHKANAAQMKTENNKLQEAAKKVPEYEERIQKLEQELQAFNEKNASLNEKHTATNKAQTEELVARATSAELAIVDLQKRVEITKLRQARTNAENNVGHCDMAIVKILAKQPPSRPQLDEWQRQKFNWENVVHQIQQIIQTQEQGYNRLLAGLNSGASLAMMEPVLKPTMPKAPEPPRDQSAQRAVLAPINVQTPIDRASPPNNRSAFHPGPPPGFSPGFQSSNGRSTPAESTTSSITSGHSAPMNPGVTKPQAQNVAKSSSLDKIVPPAPAARPAVQQPPPPPVQNGAKSADLIGKMFNALKDRFQNLERDMVVAELLALKKRSGGKITTKMDDTIELIAAGLATKLPRAVPPPPDPPATVHRTISDRDNECMICHEDMGFKNLVECKECREKYHDHCVNTWLKQKMNCPKCRAHLLPAHDFPPLQ